MAAARFNIACKLIALFVLVGGVAASVVARPGFRDLDFWQFYIAGTMARTGMWKHLYPTPMPGNPHNPGAPEDSTVSPEHQKLASALGAELTTRFIQAPPNALLYVPLSLLSPLRAYRLWLLTMAVFGWAIAVQAGQIYRILSGTDTRAVGLIVLLVACSPLMYRAVRVSNMSPMIGWALGVGIIELLRGMRLPDRVRANDGSVTPFVSSEPAKRRMQEALAGTVMLLGALAKYAPVVLVPLFALRRKWQPLAYAAVLGFAILGISLVVMGTGPFETFLEQIAPTLGRSHEQRGNQAMEGLLLRLTQTTTLPDEIAYLLRGVKWGSLALILGWLINRRRELNQSPAILCASVMALLGWMLLFAPLLWEHYLVYLCPLWGWLIYEARWSRGAAVAVVVSIALVSVPLPVGRSPLLAELVNSRPMFGALVMWGLSLWRLFDRRKGVSRP